MSEQFNDVYFIDDEGERHLAATGHPEGAGFGNTKVLRFVNGVLKIVEARVAYEIPSHTQDEANRGYFEESQS